ncbi:MAG: hypothetical protein M4D80_09060 [Myxococcota bacterium]|nr:hypothetical protein [Myxococcota bacterium]
MRNQLLLLLATSALATPAAAQPITQPSSCEVTVSRAPDEVREAIETWVRQEPRCSTTLDVRVVATDGGFYLFARDGAGRVRERVVPDANSAGVLVASWVADDLIAATTPPSPPPSQAPSVMPPSATPVVGTPSAEATAIVATTRPARTRGRWLTVGGMIDVGETEAFEDGGLRAELEVKRRGKWTLGAVLAVASDAIVSEDVFSSDYIATRNIRLLATLSRTSTLGKKWELRVGAGAGVTRTQAVAQLGGVDSEGAAFFPTAEASLLLSRSFGDSWAVALGPVVTLCPQTFKFHDDRGAMITYVERDLEVMAFGGIRRRL